MFKRQSNKTAAYFCFVFFALIAGAFFYFQDVSATEYTATNFKIFDPVTSVGAISGSSTNFGLGQSFGQIAPGKSTSSSFQLWSGYQYYYFAQANTLTATAGAGQVSLVWTAPQTSLGIVIGDYEVGTGTVSGSYTFQSVGNTTSYVKTGLTSGTTYYFKVKAKTAAGVFVVFSNEASAVPTSSGGGGGGGGGGGAPLPAPAGTASVTLKGLAYPSSKVVILKDGVIVVNTIADPAAAFNVTLNNLQSGNATFSLYTVDNNNNQSSAKSFNLLLSNNVAITVDNLFLAPSIAIDKQQVAKGDTLSIFGYAAPKSDVNVFVNSSHQFIEKIQAGDNGSWFKAFNTALLELGDHATKSQASRNNKISDYSQTLAFKVGDTTIEKKPGQCAMSDINCDSRTNLIDLSIILYYWNKPGSAQTGDFNGDGVVNLTDLSILLYHWTG